MVLVYLRPDTDASNSGWTDQAGGSSNLYQAVDETTENDTDFIRSSSNPTADIIRFRVSDPGSSVTEPFNISYRYGLTATGSLKITARLKQGSTVIKAWEHTDATTTFQTVTQTLTTGEFASITDFNDLFIEFEASPGGGSSVTWDPLNTASPISLSTDKLTASITLPNASNYHTRATGSVAASSKKYWEIAGDTIDAFSNAIANGFVDGSFVIDVLTYLGQDAHSLGYFNTSGETYTNGSQVGDFANFDTSAMVLCLAVDTVNSKIWFRVNSGGWNNDVIGNQNPATNTGGLSFSMTPPLYPALCFRSNSSASYQLTGRFASASWTYAAPSGFTQL